MLEQSLANMNFTATDLTKLRVFHDHPVSHSHVRNLALANWNKEVPGRSCQHGTYEDTFECRLVQTQFI